MNRIWEAVMIALLLLSAAMLSAAPPGKEKAKPAPGVVGEWLFRSEEMEIRLILKADGRFTRTLKTAEGEETDAGTYSAKGGKLVGKPEGESETVTLNYRLVGDNEMEIIDKDGTGVRMVRQKKAAPGEGGDSPSEEVRSSVPKAQASTGKRPPTLVLRRTPEPREKAFTILVPRGWLAEGGMMRWTPEVAGVNNAIEAKLDFTVKNDAAGTVMARWMPDISYADTSGSLAGGMFPIGSEYNGNIALPKMSITDYLVRAVLPRAFPKAADVRIVSQQPMPKLAQPYIQWARAVGLPPNMTYSGGGVTVEYKENGVRYRQLMMAVVEDFGAAGAGLWKSKSTMSLRAPAADFKAWIPVLKLIQESVHINAKWLLDEIRAVAKRAGYVGEVQANIREIDRAITEHRQKTNAEINHQMYLNLTGQEDYVNPFTKEVETGSNEWNYRWTNPAGDVIYSNDTNYDPRRDTSLQRQDFKRTPVRKPNI
ncbi:MAG: hypothetical protein IT210_25175 [Armatimonadetes bacterium]|nr:hypothetical protein [Armatimonadota bacterium]